MVLKPLKKKDKKATPKFRRTTPKFRGSYFNIYPTLYPTPETRKAQPKPVAVIEHLKKKGKLIKKLSKRQLIINELIQTERSYVDSLIQLDEFFIQPLSNTKLMSSEDYQIIFSGIHSILNINQEFLKSSLEPLSSNLAPIKQHVAPSGTRARSVSAPKANSMLGTILQKNENTAKKK